MLRYLTPRCPYDIQGLQTLAVAQISLTNYKQWDGGASIARAVLPFPPPTPHLFSPRWLRQAFPSSGSRPVLCSKLLLHRFIKSTLRAGNSGDSTLMLFSKAKLLGVFASFSFSSASPLFTLLIPHFSWRPLWLSCAYFPQYLKKPDMGECTFI